MNTAQPESRSSRGLASAGAAIATFAAVGILSSGAPASALELVDTALSAGASPAFQNGSGTLEIADSRLSWGATVTVPEPRAAWLQICAVVCTILLSTRRRRAARMPWLWALVVASLAPVALAQAPDFVTYSGRLLEEGSPVAGPVTLELRIFDAGEGGAQLYSEEHLNVPLDATGGFAVQLGLGTSPSGPFDAGLFANGNRWLEVVVDTEVMAPREIIGSVPWALISQQANEIVRDPDAPRFKDCGDGTVADRKTGLQWEKKVGTPGPPVSCRDLPCPDPHDLNNTYDLSPSPSSPAGSLGTAFRQLIDRLNGETDPPAATGCFADRCDWRLPTAPELQTILIGPAAAPGQARTCSVPVCVDPEFAAVAGPTQPADYWALNLTNAAWSVYFDDGTVDTADPPEFDNYARAVRTGACD